MPATWGLSRERRQGSLAKVIIRTLSSPTIAVYKNCERTYIKHSQPQGTKKDPITTCLGIGITQKVSAQAKSVLESALDSRAV